jgi:hypothetical protein
VNGGERGIHPGSRVVRSDQFAWGVYMTLDFLGFTMFIANRLLLKCYSLCNQQMSRKTRRTQTLKYGTWFQ